MKEENMLDLQDDDLGDKTDIEKSKIEKTLKCLQKKIKRNSDLKHLTNNARKGQKMSYGN